MPTLRRLTLLALALAGIAAWRRWPRPSPTARDVNRLLQARRREHHTIVSWHGTDGPLATADAGLGRARVTIRSRQHDRSCATMALLTARGWLEQAGYRVVGEPGTRPDDPGSLLVHPPTAGPCRPPFGTSTGLLALVRSLWTFARRRQVGEAVAFGPGERWLLTWARQPDGAPLVDRGTSTVPAAAPGRHHLDRHFTCLVLRGRPAGGLALSVGFEPRAGRRWPTWWAAVRRLVRPARPFTVADAERMATTGHTNAADLADLAGRGVEVGTVMGVHIERAPDRTVERGVVEAALWDRLQS